MPKVERLVYINVEDILEPDILLHPKRDLEKLKDLADSIKEKGLINPVVVRPVNGKYKIVAGHQRWLACKLFGIGKVPCRIVNVGDEDALLISAIENIQRREHDLIEEGRLYRKLIGEHGYTEQLIAEKLGKSV